MNKFSKSSQKKLNTCHSDLKLIMATALEFSNIDFGIAEGHRSIELQQKYFREGKSKIDGINKKGKHNYSPSLAADIYLWINRHASWNKKSLCYIAGIIHAVTKILYSQHKITHKIRWGGNWDMDGEILTDQSFNDFPHFELI